ncbi:MAG TPA: caspase family protein [Kofleriaceae bacterium]|nr:caspase family protein [Kofleriaceae bacterium]
MRRLLATCAIAAGLGLAPAAASAEVIRFAVLVGSNRGQADEANLRYAESDAARMRDVLLDLGGFHHENVVTMQNADAVAVRQAIVALNERIRALSGSAQVVLLVYYSGHADAEDLHLGATRFSTRELEQLVGGSAADVRLLVVDSCRSGALTRTKGGRHGPSFSIQLDERLASHGAIYLTSSAANEDAQESDELKGSFFTHYLVSGMLGAADQSGEGEVDLSEAYRYAYDNTLRASSRTLAGIQHPSFRYAMSGHDGVVLTRLTSPGGRRGWLAFPPGRSYLVLEGNADGPVVAEVGLWDRRRAISVREGRYFVRARGRENLLEGTIDVPAGARRAISDGDLDRIAYARLVRKGSDVLDSVHGPVFGLRGRSPLANAEGVSPGLMAGWAVERQTFNLAARVTYQHAGFARGIGPSYIEADIEELGAEIRLGHTWDTPWFAVEPFVAGGASIFWQRFGSDRVAPRRTSGAAHVDAGAGIRRDVDDGTYVLLEGAMQTYWFRQAGHGDELAPTVGIAVTAGIGFWL